MRSGAWIRRTRRWLADRLDTSGETSAAVDGADVTAGDGRAVISRHRRARSEPLDPGPAARPDVLNPSATVRPPEVELAPEVSHPWQRGGVPWNLRAVSEWSWRFIVIAVAVLLALWILVRLRLVVFPLIVALFLAALMRPAVARLERRGVKRGLATATVFVGGIALVVGIGVVVGNVFADGLGGIGDNVEAAIDDTKEWLAGPPFRISESELKDFTDNISETFEANQDAVVSGVVDTATVVAEVVTGIVLTLFITFFFLYDGERIWRWVVSLFPQPAIPHVAEAGNRAWRTLTGYVRGTILIALVDAVFIGLILLILGVPLALPLSVLVFFGAFVPLVGAFVTGTVAVLVALVTKGFVIALIVLAGIVAVQQIEGHVLQPLVLGRFVRVHPLGVILAITAGAILAGIGGAVIAVPVVAVANTVGRYFVDVARERRAAAEVVEPGG